MKSRPPAVVQVAGMWRVEALGSAGEWQVGRAVTGEWRGQVEVI